MAAKATMCCSPAFNITAGQIDELVDKLSGAIDTAIQSARG
jgi:adenosylmethionine-8-amino-7-oxononanoate aminotransferase